MGDPQLLAQARKGNAIAIAALLNRALQPQGIWARVESVDQRLVIALESPQAPAVDQVAPRIRAGLEKLQPQGITQVTLQGFALGEVEPNWTQQISLTAADLGAKEWRSLDYQPIRLSESTATPDPEPSSPSTLKPLNLGTASPGQRSRSYPPFRRSITRHSQQPLVIKWSDFDPMMLAIIGFVAVYGFMGARNPGLDGPFIWLHYPDLAIHETGHLLFMPFGHFLMVLGGSLAQIAFPAVFTGYFYYTQQFFSSALTLFWTGQNFMDVAVYMADAPYRALPLTGPNPDCHDWWQLFNMMNCMGQAELIAGITHWIGVLIYLASIVAGVYFAYLHKQTMVAEQRRREARLRGEEV